MLDGLPRPPGRDEAEPGRVLAVDLYRSRAPLIDLVGRLAVPAFARALNLRNAKEGALPSGPILRPYAQGRRYTTSHYNVVIPDLPAPHYFLACAAFLGRTGTRAFDIDHASAGSPRTTATLAFGTAATAPDWFGTYSTQSDCELHEDGSLLRFGKDLTIAGEFPAYRVVASRSGFAVDIELTCTEQVTWFARSPIYDHYGFPARYRGTLTWQGSTLQIEGVLSLEYARALSLSALVDRPIPKAMKLPCDFFTYHVLAVAPDTLLMLTDVQALGRSLLTTAYVRQLDGVSTRTVGGVSFEVLAMREHPQLAPDGASTPMPSEFRWRIVSDGQVTTEITGRPDTELIYGLGRGWIGGYGYEGHHGGEPINGHAYYEYVDRR